MVPQTTGTTVDKLAHIGEQADAAERVELTQ